jgi:acetyl esterase/lipase
MPNFKILIFQSTLALGIIFSFLSQIAAQDKAIDATKSGVVGQAPIETAPATVDVWTAGTMPGKGAKDPEADLPSRGDNVQRITNISRPTLTLFPAKNKKAPGMIVCPGGGYSYLGYDKEGTEIAAWLNSNGITALILKYRVPNNRQGALQDLQRAFSLARANSAKWHINPKRLGVIGFSAGEILPRKQALYSTSGRIQPLIK